MDKALPSSTINAKHYMLTSSICLDLFEKITNTGPGGRTFGWGISRAHLLLFRPWGWKIERPVMFLRLLVRLVTNCTISSVASDTAVPRALLEIRSHLERHLAIGTDPKWKLTGLMAEYAFLQSGIANPSVSLDECINMAWGLDLKLMELSQSMTKGWLPEIQGARRLFSLEERFIQIGMSHRRGTQYGWLAFYSMSSYCNITKVIMNTKLSRKMVYMA